MSLIKKSDVKNHLSTRTGASAVPAPAVFADATGYSEDPSQERVGEAGSDPTARGGMGEMAAPAANAEKPQA